MKGLWTKILVIACIAGAVYCWLNCVVIVGDGEFAVFEDREHSEFGLLDSGLSFLWQGVVPERLRVVVHRRRLAETMELKLAIPPLGELKSDYYRIGVPVKIVADIDPRRLSIEPKRIAADRKAVGEELKSALEAAFQRELSPYLAPLYNPNAIAANQAAISRAAIARGMEWGRSAGIDLRSIETAGGFQLPDQRTYNDGMKYYRDLQELERGNKKKLIELVAEIEKEKRLRAVYLEKLSEISRLIRANPALLKYIYIDRLAGNVRVIIAPERSGMPLGLDFDDTVERAAKKGNIDNLR